MKTTRVERLAIEERLAVHASLARLYQGLRAEDQFLRSLSRSREAKTRAPDQRADTNRNQPQGKATIQRPDSKAPPGSMPGKTTSAARTHKLPLNSIFLSTAFGVVGTPGYPDLLRPELRVATLLQSARAQELRAEIERILTMAARLAGGARSNGEFRWVLSPSLFPGTTIVLRRQENGWRLDATVGDEECRELLNSGAAELRRRFSSKDLGDLVVTIEIDAKQNEPSSGLGEHTSQSQFSCLF